MKIGYARVSTNEQNLDRQYDQLTAHGCERIFMEKITGSKKERPELERMIDILRDGDTVLITELTRLSRSVKDLFEIVEFIRSKHADIKSLKEPWLDTTTPQGKLLFTIFAGISQFDRDIIRQRTLEGLSSARARGRKGGRPKAPSQKMELALKMYDSKDYSISEIEHASGISKSTLYRYLNISGAIKITSL
ncbi:MAG: recombinase family protein [Mucispirillum sp.]|nr:recombinase family protein [Mucispirillum sp.]